MIIFHLGQRAPAPPAHHTGTVSEPAPGATGQQTRDEHERARHTLDHLSNERKLLVWVRLGITIIVLGFVIARFGVFLEVNFIERQLPPAIPAWSLPIGVALVTAGALLIVAAGRRFFQIEREIEEGRLGRHYQLIDLLLFGTVVTAVVLIGYLIVAGSPLA